MKTPEDLTRAQLEDVVRRVQEILYLTDFAGKWIYTPDKLLDMEDFWGIDNALKRQGLRPTTNVPYRHPWSIKGDPA